MRTEQDADIVKMVQLIERIREFFIPMIQNNILSIFRQLDKSYDLLGTVQTDIHPETLYSALETMDFVLMVVERMQGDFKGEDHHIHELYGFCKDLQKQIMEKEAHR